MRSAFTVPWGEGEVAWREVETEKEPVDTLFMASAAPPPPKKRCAAN